MITVARSLSLTFSPTAKPLSRKQAAWGPRDVRRRFILAGGLIVLAMVALLGIELGTTRASLRDLMDAASPLHYIAVNLRLPRVLTGMVVGASLALSGALLQGLLRNPLADPGVLGVTNFAGLGAALAYLFLPIGLLAAPVAAFGFALFSAFIVIVMAGGREAGGSRLILCGIALGATASALLSVAMLLTHDEVMPLITWLMGSVGGKSWAQVRWAGSIAVAGCSTAMALGRPLNVMQLGEAAARGLGLNYRRMRLAIIFTASLLVANSASLAGLVGFIGLIAPHLARMLVGDDYRFLLPVAAVIGATLVTGGDLAARTLLSPTELPVGAITALCGGPFFFYLVFRPQKSKLCPASY